MSTSWPHQLPVVPPPVNYPRLHRSTSPLCILYSSIPYSVFLYLYRSKYGSTGFNKTTQCVLYKCLIVFSAIHNTYASVRPTDCIELVVCLVPLCTVYTCNTRRVSVIPVQVPTSAMQSELVCLP